MKPVTRETVSIVHNKVPNRIRLRVPVIKNKATYAALLRQNLLRDSAARGIYHAEPNIITGTILIKYHPAFHNEADILRTVSQAAHRVADGGIEITAKHKEPKLGKMRPQAFFTRELLVSICGNVIAGLILAAVIAG
ncbi:HMA2 domain-containing protein [Candidatus Methylocalor cossyra]|uniref:Uncharacterized protein n=1 Tax=Candidatus Methylocalor cossyra TaxID=3108543 RepID=A0ABP1C6X3_9GAMM